jgi:enoyl-CoA hydratase
LVPRSDFIARCFEGDEIEAIMARLDAACGAEQAFAQSVLADLKKRSPTSLKITLKHLRQAAGLDLRDVLAIDQRLACHCLDGHDFAEGVRAALIDKDNLPVWRPADIGAVTADMVEAHFAPLEPAFELKLATREEMQSARV